MTPDANRARRPLVSIIVPSYNYGNFIERTLDSAAAQTYETFECLIVDDGSTDDTADRVVAFVNRDPRFIYLRRNKEGVSAARNAGIARSRGEYVQFLDSDDLLEPQKLERHVGFLEKHPDVDIVYGGALYFRSEDLVEAFVLKRGNDANWIPKLSAKDENALLTLVDTNLPLNTAIIRRRVFDDVGMFEPGLRQIEDWDFLIRCAAAGKRFQFQNSQHTRALYRSHSTSVSANRADALGQCIALRKKIARRSYPANVLQKNQSRKATTIGECGIEECAQRNFVYGIKLLTKAAFLSRRPMEKAKWLLCAIVAPFVSSADLRQVVVTPFAQIIRHGVHRPELSGETLAGG